jgi:integral membrane sensor domain MASE1
MAEPEKRRWTDPVVLVPIIGAVIAAIVGPVVVSMIQQSPDEPVPVPITPV